MALISPDEYKKTKGLPSGSNGGNSGLIPPAAFKQQRQQAPIPDTRPKTPTFQESVSAGNIDAPPINPASTPIMQEASKIPLDQPRLRVDYPGGKLNPVNLLNAARNTTVGSFVDRFAQSGGKVIGLTPEQMSPPASTGNKVADTIADIAGGVSGYFVNPGNLSQGPSALYRASEPFLTKVGSKIPSVGDNLTNRAIQEALEQGATGAAYAVPHSLMQEDVSTGSIAKNALIEGTLGAGIGMVAPFVGAGLKAAGQGLKSMSETAPVARFSALGRSVGQKTKTPDNPENVKDLIDVGGRADRKEGGSTWEKFYSSVVNEQAPLARATKELGGKDVPIDQNPEKLAWLSRGWKGKADSKLQYGFLDSAGKKIAKSFKEALDPIKTKLDDWREYAVALRSKEYKDASLQSGVSDELADRTIAKYADRADVHQADKDIKDYVYNMNKSTLVDSGIWNEAKLNNYRDTQANYIPMYRTQEKGLRDGVEGAGAKAYGNVKDPTKRRTGSNKPIVDPLESIAKQTYKNQALADRNNVMRSLVELAENAPDNAIIRRVEPTKALDEVQKSLDDFIANPSDDLEKQLQSALDLFKPQTVNGKPNVFTVMRNGKAEQWQIMDDQVAKVIAGLGGEPSNPLVNLVGKATGVLKAGLVLAPDFVVKNLVRDQMSAFINSKYGFIPLWDTVSGLVSAARKDDTFYKWMANGGANGAWVSLERDYLQGQLNDLLRKPISKFKNPVEILRTLSEWSEQGTRLGEFKRGIKKGASLKDAALASRDITLDFSRSGSKTKSVNKAVAFFNVAIQSLDKMARQFKDRPVATPVKAVASITIPSIALYLLNQSNPKYQELPQWEKDTYWHFFLGDEVLRIPKPFEMGIVFGTFFERMMKDIKENDPKAFDGFAKQVFEGFTPSIIPTLITPWIEAYANKDMFSKAPIVPKREEGLLKQDQYGPYTTEIAKSAGKLTKQSPRVIENYITGYTGTLGRYGLQIADSAFKTSRGIESAAKPDQGLAGQPVARSFFSRNLEGSSQSVEEFYKEKDKLSQERASAKKGSEPYKDEAKYKLYNRIGEQISNIQGRIRAINEDKQMSPAEKREKLKTYNLQVINLARQAKGFPPVKE